MLELVRNSNFSNKRCLNQAANERALAGTGREFQGRRVVQGRLFYTS